MISTRSSSDGNGTQSLNRNRSSWASGSGIGALHLERVLRGQDEERWLEQVAFARDRHLLLLHRLQQRRLRLGRRPVDLVRQQQVGEDRSGLEAELALAVLLDQDVRADDVGRHQVGRELDAVEGAVEHVGDRPHEHRLAQAGHAFEQRVAVGDEADQRLPDELVLADDDCLDLGLDRSRAICELLDGKLCYGCPLERWLSHQPLLVLLRVDYCPG